MKISHKKKGFIQLKCSDGSEKYAEKSGKNSGPFSDFLNKGFFGPFFAGNEVISMHIFRLIFG